MVLTYTIETDGRQADANQHMVLTHTIETDVFDPYNRNRWPHNSRATAFCHAWPILLFVFHAVLYPLLRMTEKGSGRRVAIHLLLCPYPYDLDFLIKGHEILYLVCYALLLLSCYSIGLLHTRAYLVFLCTPTALCLLLGAI